MAPDLPIETWAQIRHDYEHTEKPIDDICAEHGISSGTLRDRVRRWRWTRRRAPIPAEGPPPSPAPQFEPAAPLIAAAPPIDTAPSLPQAETATPVAPAPPANPAEIARGLQSGIVRVLPAIEAILARLGASHTQPREMEHAARALGSLTRTLRELNALLRQYPQPADTDRGPDDPDEFIQELVRRMDHFAASYAASSKPEEA